MLRPILFTAGLLAVEALVVVHWFLLPQHGGLRLLAGVAAVAMTAMAALALALFVGVLRRDPRRPQDARELADLGHIEPLWAATTAFQLAFIAAAWAAGVFWFAAALTLGQGAELAAVALARRRTRHLPPLA